MYFPLAGTQQQKPAQHLLHTVTEPLCHCGVYPWHQHRHVSGQCLHTHTHTTRTCTCATSTQHSSCVTYSTVEIGHKNVKTSLKSTINRQEKHSVKPSFFFFSWQQTRVIYGVNSGEVENATGVVCKSSVDNLILLGWGRFMVGKANLSTFKLVLV